MKQSSSWIYVGLTLNLCMYMLEYAEFILDSED